MKKSSPETAPAHPFFLQTDLGRRFCLYHAPMVQDQCRGGLLYVHPFAEEMNKSRRMAALQARAFAAMGFGVLQIDLFGCGDSSGDFADARWNIWMEDLTFACRWLEERIPAPIGLWGLRLGTLLALDFARNCPKKFAQIILWQPIISGESFLTQFLRLRLASEMLSTDGGKTGGTGALRRTLKEGKPVEVAGYELAPALAYAVDRLKAAELVVKGVPVHWFEVVSDRVRGMTPAGERVVSAWRQSEANLHLHLVPCRPFWATQEITECAELTSATVTALAC